MSAGVESLPTSRLRAFVWWTLIALLVAFTATFLLTCVRIVLQAHQDEARHADAIVVFGAAEYSGKPSPVLRARLDHAFDLYQRNLAPIMITTGGAGWDPTYTEGGVSKDYLVSLGVPERQIIAETWSDNTSESASRVARIMQRNGMHSCIAVSDPYHLFRIKQMLRKNGINVYVSPRPQGKVPDKLRLQNLAHEAASYIAWRMHITDLM